MMPTGVKSGIYAVAVSRPAQVAFLALAVALVYGHTLDAPFYFDSHLSISGNPAIKDLADIRAIWRYAPNRVIGYLSFAINYHVHQLDVPGYHLTNIAIHFLAVFFAFSLAAGLLRSPGVQERLRPDGAVVWFPLLVALVFALHPLQTQAVTYMVQRLASLVAMFYIGALACYVQARLRSRLVAKAGFGLAALSLAMAAFFTKQNSATLPIAILLIELVFFRQNRRYVFCLSLFTVAGLAFFYLLVTVLCHHDPFSLQAMEGLTRETDTITRQTYWATQNIVLWRYIRMFFWPTGLNLDHDVALAAGIFDWRVMIAFAGHVGVVTLALRWIRHQPLIGFGVLFYYLAHLVESSVIPIKDVMFEHRTYLPNLGLCLGSGWLLMLAMQRGKVRASVRAAAVTTVILMLGLFTYQRNSIWRNPVNLWLDCVAKSPNKARVHNHAGIALFRAGRTSEAMDHYLAALSLSPGYAEPHLNLGNLYAGQGQPEQAERHYQAAIRLKPKNGAAHYDLAYLLAEQGDVDGARDHYVQALRCTPGDERTLNNLASLLASQGRLQEAAEYFAQLLDINPTHAVGHCNLAKVFAEMGRPDDAIMHYEEALRCNPQSVDAAMGLGVLFHSQGRLESAANAYLRVLSLAPDDIDALFNLGLLRGRQGQLRKAQRRFAEVLRLMPDHLQARRFHDQTVRDLQALPME